MNPLRRAGSLTRLVAIAAGCIAALVFTSGAFAASVTPTQVSGNPRCSTLDSSWSGFKIDNSSVAGTYFVNGGTITVTQANNGGSFSWTSTFGIDAVLVKGGTDTNVYGYSPESTGDSDLSPPDTGGLSHVDFCYDTGDNPCETGMDSDSDGVSDACDNCPEVANPGQEDSDQNGMGDACQPPPTCEEAHAGEADTDDDGVVDACDNCPEVMNPGQEDSDSDGTGDACEPQPTCEEMHAGESDSDDDGVVDACDNCPEVMNPGQEDSDNDNVGDACEPIPTCAEMHAGENDSDGDTIVDACDNCPNAANMSQTDSDNDGTGDACEPVTPNNPTPTTTTETPPPPAQVTAPAEEPGAQAVLGERITPGTARLLAATGCTARAFNARVRGTGIARVVFYVDGKRVKTLAKPNKKGLFSIRVNPKRMRVGVHRLVAKVRFKASTRTKARTLRASFQRCAHRLVAPRFTG